MHEQGAHPTSLQQPATVAGLRRLRRAGLIDDRQFATMRRRIWTTERWLDLARPALLGVGTALVLAGTIYLFAFNWQELGRFAKLGVAAATQLACVVAAAVLGRATLAGKVAITAAAVLVGLFLAVFGQIYQTGADAYELFVGWTALIVPYVLAAEFTALWVLWYLLVEVAVMLAWEQVLLPAGIPMEVPFTLLATAGAALLTLREHFARRGVPWLQETWARHVGLVAVLVATTLPVLTWLFEGRGTPNVTAATLAVWLIAIGALGWAAWYVVPDVLAMGLIVLDVCVVIDCGLGQLLFEGGGDAVGPLAVLSVVTLLAFGGAGALLRELHRRLASGAGGHA